MLALEAKNVQQDFVHMALGLPLKFPWKGEGTRVTRTILELQSQVGRGTSHELCTAVLAPHTFPPLQGSRRHSRGGWGLWHWATDS